LDKVYTPQQAAEILSISDKTLMDWLRAGKIKGVKVGKYWRIMEADLEEFLRQNRAADKPKE
jgi:excisionase family DNA binding protein